MIFKYNFTKVDADRQPIVDPIVITNPINKKKVSYPAMLDTGSFTNIFNAEIAEVLGIDLSKIKEHQVFSGVGKESKALKGKYYNVEIMIFQKGKNYTFDSLVLFTDAIDEKFPLLGRMGFFDCFKEVRFNYETNKFYLETKQ